MRSGEGRWSVYIIRCDDDSLYTGITTDIQRRFSEHAGTDRGARYFNGRRPVKVIYSESGHTRSSASKLEAAIKKMKRSEKLEWIAARKVDT